MDGLTSLYGALATLHAGEGLLLRGTRLTIVLVDGALLVCRGLSRDFRNGSKRALLLIVAQALLSLSAELVHVSFPVTFRLDTHHATESPPFLSVLRKPWCSLLKNSLQNLIGYPWDPRDSRQIPRIRVAHNSAQLCNKTRSIHLALAVSMLRPFSWKWKMVAPLEPC